jgi:hypothetical protein
MGIRRLVLPAPRPWAACRGDVAVHRSWRPGRDGAAAPADRHAGAAGSWSPRSARRRRGAAICRAVPWPRQDHRASHDAVELDRRVAHVRVIDPHHPLYGSCLLVSDRRSGRGPNLIVVRLPDGRERSIPRVATDLVRGPAGPSQVAERQRHISVRTLFAVGESHPCRARLPPCGSYGRGAARSNARKIRAPGARVRRRRDRPACGASSQWRSGGNWHSWSASFVKRLRQALPREMEGHRADHDAVL